METVLNFVKTIRVHQWTKNLLVFAALVFSRNLGEGSLVLKTIYAFFAFCLLSSSVYVINDILDAERDRAHPVKCKRPIASGKLKVKSALAGAFLLFLLAIVLGWIVDGGPIFISLLGGYFALNLAYSTFLKQVVVADVMVIAFGFLIRVAAGGKAIGVEVSHWLILCTFFVATMLASCKRHAELRSMDGNNNTRAVLADYTLSLLNIYIAISGTATILAYALYTVSERTLKEFNTSALIYTVPVVMYGISRYLFLVYRQRAGEDPAADLARDPGMILAVLIWLGLSFGILYQAA